MEEFGLFTHVNDSIRSLATEPRAAETWEFFCECPDVGCHALVSLTLVEFDQRRTSLPPVPILASGHGGRVG
ncbi:MAG TPA: hypothetical protein VH541_01455 [Gaiellaceae bacterium]|jgi:hypothetical protein